MSRPRTAAVMRPQPPSNAARPARTASSTSAAVPRAMRAITWPSDGLITGRLAAVARQAPPM